MTERAVIRRFLAAWWPSSDRTTWFRGREREPMTPEEGAVLDAARETHIKDQTQ